jgi:membrane protein implicated in regulation of membrane protease activity
VYGVTHLLRPAAGPPGAAPYFAAQRPDHSLPEVLSDDELALAIATLRRKRDSSRRMLTTAKGARVAFYAAMLVAGFFLLWLGPAPFLEFVTGQRALAATWDVFAWWFAILAAFAILGAAATNAARSSRRRAEGRHHRVEDVERRLAAAEAELASRRTG